MEKQSLEEKYAPIAWNARFSFSHPPFEKKTPPHSVFSPDPFSPNFFSSRDDKRGVVAVGSVVGYTM